MNFQNIFVEFWIGVINCYYVSKFNWPCHFQQHQCCCLFQHLKNFLPKMQQLCCTHLRECPGVTQQMPALIFQDKDVLSSLQADKMLEENPGMSSWKGLVKMVRILCPVMLIMYRCAYLPFLFKILKEARCQTWMDRLTLLDYKHHYSFHRGDDSFLKCWAEIN